MLYSAEQIMTMRFTALGRKQAMKMTDRKVIILTSRLSLGDMEPAAPVFAVSDFVPVWALHLRDNTVTHN